MAFAALLEGLQAFTPDRSANLLAAVCGAGGALAAALLAELFIRARRRRALPMDDLVIGRVFRSQRDPSIFPH